MKRMLVLSIIIVWTLCSASRSLGQAYSLDIDVQGPWILYQDNDFQINGIKAPVLVLMAPDVMSSHVGEYNHQPAGFSAGDGTQLNPSTIYCVQFVNADGTSCAPQRSPAPSSGIAKPNMLSVNAPKHWAWYGATDADRAGRTYVILPLPDDYINDGVWWIKTGQYYDAYSTTYTPNLVSLGIYLHYNSISASRVQLLKCDPPTAHDASTCTTKVYSLLNRGSLRIDMKTPVNNDACDFHVRFAYPKMLKMLDSTPLYGTKPMPSTNINADKAFVSPAKVFQESGGTYDGDMASPLECANDDPQTRYPELQATTAEEVRTYSQTVQMDSMAAEPSQDIEKEQSQFLNKSTVLTRLDRIISAIEKLHDDHKACDRGEADPYLGCRFEDLRKMLSQSDGALTYSQTEDLNKLLKEALKFCMSPPRQPRLEPTPIDEIMGLEVSMVDHFATKNGNDCRAPIMLAQ